MDPFEELTISSKSGSQRDRVQASATPAAQQGLPLHGPFAQPPVSGSTRGNPFQEQTGPASASATRLAQPCGSAFGVRTCAAEFGFTPYTDLG